MAEAENLSIILDVVDNFSDELLRLILLLENVQAAAEMADASLNLNVNVRGEHQLATLIGKMEAIEAMELSDAIGDIVVGDKNIRRTGSSGGGGLRRSQFKRLDLLMTAQVHQMGRMMRSMGELDEAALGASRAMGNAMDASDKAADQFRFSNLRMSDMHNALANILPLLFIFIGALPAAVTGLVAVGAAALSAAAGLLAIAGLGALGAAMARGDGEIMEGLQDIASELADDFLDAFSPLARRLEPVFEDFISGLDRLFQAIADDGDVLMALVDDARAFGRFMMDFIPGTLSAMGQMAEAFGPVLAMVADFTEDMDLLAGLTSFMADILPSLAVFTRLVIGAIIRLVEMSKGFLRVANVIGVFLSIVLEVITVGGRLNEEIGALVAGLLLVISTVAILGSALWATVIPSLAAMGQTMLGVLASATAAAGGVTILDKMIMFLTANTWRLAAATAVATAGLSILLGLAATHATRWSMMGSEIDSATSSLRAFDRVARGMDGLNPYRHPNIERGSVSGSSRFSGSGGITVNIEGDANEDTVRKQTQNALYRMERPRRSV